ncbi:MAG: type 2 lanthipeptide synthetase LanM family protein [Acidobacteriota bacterium]
MAHSAGSSSDGSSSANPGFTGPSQPVPAAQLAPIFQQAVWYRALTLAERRRLLENRPVPNGDRGEAEDLLHRWRSLPSFAGDDLFQQRLDLDGWTEEDLLKILGAPPEALQDAHQEHHGEAPGWLQELEAAFLSTDDLPLEDLAPSRGEESSPFLATIRPLLTPAYRRLERCFAELPQDVPWDQDQVLRTLFSHLAGRLSMIQRRVMVLELQIAHLEESLEGETPQERFYSFTGRLGDRKAALEILARYPVLTRIIVQCIRSSVDFSTEFLRRYARDWRQIAADFDLQRPPLGLEPEASAGGGENLLWEARPGAGDSHRDGRSVILMTFSSGARLVYKPRPLGGEKAFNDLLHWVNQRGFEPAYRVLKVVHRGDYGWEEFVAPFPCEDGQQVQRFYRRQGGYLALLYLLEANDIHFENLIAAGEHPVLIDLETLFHPAADLLGGEQPTLPAGNSLYRSVQHIGLLPHRMWGTEEIQEGVDLSGLGAGSGQVTAQRFLTLKDAGTDSMRFVREQAEIPDADHSPQLAGSRVQVDDYLPELSSGFDDLYRLIHAHRHDLASASGPLAAFHRAECRIIFRPTVFYNELLGESLHPDVTQDALERELYLESLWAEARLRPQLKPLIPSELADLRRIDIPLFGAFPESKDLFNASGEKIEAFHQEPPMASVRAKLEAWGEADRQRQKWLIETSLHTILRPDAALTRESYPFRESSEGATPKQLLDAAREVGDRLANLAFSGRSNEVTWPIVSPVGAGHWTHNPAEPGLYQGLAGIALFLAYLGNLLDAPRYAELARGAWKTLRHQLSSGLVKLPGVGAFTGSGGVLYGAAHLALLWGDEELLDEAEAMLEDLPQQLAEDQHHDLIGGAAGMILCLRSLHRARPSQRVLDAIEKCAESLLTKARPMEVGCGWLIPAAGPNPLAGLSHGGAGFALALLEAAALTGQERFRQLALRAIDYERTLFDPEVGNWIDLREGDRPEGGIESSGHHFVVGWCHGAPGIGLARVMGLAHLDTPTVRQEIEIALATTLDDGFGANHSLCHGDLGNLELLFSAAKALHRPELLKRTYRIAAGSLHGVEQYGWLYGYPSRVEPLGLMVGLAGIGHQLLRLTKPDAVPSVLTLEPPPP